MKLYLPIILVLLASLLGCQKTMGVPVADGEKLVQSLWTDFKTNDERILGNWLAQGFQSVHQDGFRNRDQELLLLKNLNLGSYELDDFNSSQDGNIVNVTYTVSVSETIEGKQLPTSPAQRLSVFMFDGESWKWIAHANLNPMNK